jgi:hypothetical protein
MAGASFFLRRNFNLVRLDKMEVKKSGSPELLT